MGMPAKKLDNSDQSGGNLQVVGADSDNSRDILTVMTEIGAKYSPVPDWVMDYFVEDMVAAGTWRIYKALVKKANYKSNLTYRAGCRYLAADAKCRRGDVPVKVQWLIDKGLITLAVPADIARRKTAVYRIVQEHRDIKRVFKMDEYHTDPTPVPDSDSPGSQPKPAKTEKKPASKSKTTKSAKKPAKKPVESGSASESSPTGNTTYGRDSEYNNFSEIVKQLKSVKWTHDGFWDDATLAKCAKSWLASWDYIDIAEMIRRWGYRGDGPGLIEHYLKTSKSTIAEKAAAKERRAAADIRDSEAHTAKMRQRDREVEELGDRRRSHATDIMEQIAARQGLTKEEYQQKNQAYFAEQSRLHRQG